MGRVEIDSGDNSITGRLRSLIVTIFHLDWSSELELNPKYTESDEKWENTSLTVIG